MESKTTIQVVNKLGETLEHLHSNALSLVALSDEWDSVEASIAAAEAALAAKEKCLESRKKDIAEIEVWAKGLLAELKKEHKKAKTENRELKERAIRAKKMEKELNDRERLLEIWESRIDGRTGAEGVEEVRRWELVDGLRVLEARKVEVEERRRVLEAREAEMEVRESRLKERWEAFSREMRVKEEMLGDKEQKMRKMCKELEGIHLGLKRKWGEFEVVDFEEMEGNDVFD